MGTAVRHLQVVYGYLPCKISRRQAERFITLHAAAEGLPVPQPPIAQYWCREAPAGAPAKYMVGWSGPAACIEPDPAPSVVELAH